MSERRVAMVTGATGGLGRTLVPDLAADGWDLSAALANRFCHLDWTVSATAENSVEEFKDLGERS